MRTIKTALENLGFKEEQEQIAFIKLIGICDINKEHLFENVTGEKAAKAILGKKRFQDDTEALSWIKNVTQDLFFPKKDYKLLDASSKDYAENRNSILSLLEELGLTQERHPKANAYDYITVLGATEKACKTRLDYLAQLLNKDHITAKKIVLLGSTRLLMPEFEKDSIIDILGQSRKPPIPSNEIEKWIEIAANDPILDSISNAYERDIVQIKIILEQGKLGFDDWPTEADMLKYLFLQRQKTFPPPLNTIEFDVMSSPMLDKETGLPEPKNTEYTVQRLLNGELRRANTKDTFLDFSKSLPDCGEKSILSISHQPYALHQHGQFLSIFSQDKSTVIETAGPAKPIEDVNLHHALGCLAKYIYEIHDIAVMRTKKRNATTGVAL